MKISLKLTKNQVQSKVSTLSVKKFQKGSTWHIHAKLFLCSNLTAKLFDVDFERRFKGRNIDLNFLCLQKGDKTPQKVWSKYVNLRPWIMFVWYTGSYKVCYFIYCILNELLHYSVDLWVVLSYNHIFGFLHITHHILYMARIKKALLFVRAE